MTATQPAAQTVRAIEIEVRVRALLAHMSLDEKIAQMTQAEKNSITPAAVAQFGIGSVLSGGGGSPTPNTPAAWAALVRGFLDAAQRARLAIPLIYGVDAVHGHNNLAGATIFPHNIGLGAAGDPALVERVAAVTAQELLATHVRWNFAPAVSVARDPRWGRTYESFGNDPALAGKLGAATVRGLQQAEPARPVLACAKHFVADGGTTWGTTPRYPWISGLWQSSDPHKWQLDQGDARIDEAELRAIHLAPYADAIAAGARTIMVSYSSWLGEKLHAHGHLLTGLLKQELGFSGFLVSDWLAVSQLDTDFETAVALAICAGVDMVMVPFEWARFMAAVRTGVETGRIPPARVDDAVTRILRVKMEMGLFADPFGDEALLPAVGCAAHRAIAREAVARSLVLLKNDGSALSLPAAPARVLVAGPADDLGMQCGGWTIAWQGSRGPITEGTTLLDAVRTQTGDGRVLFEPTGDFASSERAPVALVVVGEVPYAEGDGDRATLHLTAEDAACVERVRPHCDRLVLVIYAGRPLLLDAVWPLCDAVVAAWLPGSEGDGLADALFGVTPFSGALPQPWPFADGSVPALPVGYGLKAG